MNRITREGIKNVVREHYAHLALGTSDCCHDAQVLETSYPAQELATLPEAVTAAAAGCGNPLALAHLQTGEVVLDLGSGGGIDCFLAARAVGPQGLVLGVDMTLEMVALATRNARLVRAENVRFILGDMEHLPLAEGMVDLIVSNCVINLSPDKDAVFAEAFRVLKPGGRLYVSDILLERELPPKVRQDPLHWASCIAGAELQGIYLGRMEAVGFREIKVLQRTPYRPEELPGILSAQLQARKPPR
ncbi:MAG: arsenite methyltransferase [Dehalococcoidia bacterium]